MRIYFDTDDERAFVASLTQYALNPSGDSRREEDEDDPDAAAWDEQWEEHKRHMRELDEAEEQRPEVQAAIQANENRLRRFEAEAEAEQAKAEKVEARRREWARVQEKWRNALDRVTFGNESYAVDEWSLNLGIAIDGDDPREQKRLRQMVLKGNITSLLGRQLEGADLVRMRNRLLGTYDALPPPKVLWDRLHAEAAQERRWLVSGLWPWGHKPMLGGNKGAGKTPVVIDLVASLIIPGRKFLNYFEVPEMSDEDFGAGIWLINAETPAEDMDGALSRELAGYSNIGEDYVHVEHLQEDFGGPHMFDLTNPEIYALWFDRLNECTVCDGDDNQPPFVVIVDGLTAILGGSTSRYGEWYAKFRELMYALDIPNALVTVHNTMAGGHPMGGVEAAAGADGVWRYSSDNQDNPFSKRRFSAAPRFLPFAVPPSLVTMGDDERLTLHPKDRSRKSSSSSSSSSSSPDETSGADDSAQEPAAPITELVLAYVRGCNALGNGPTLTQVRSNVAARNVDVDAVVVALVKENELEERARPQRGGGKSYWVIGS
jgi:AAA domain